MSVSFENLTTKVFGSSALMSEQVPKVELSAFFRTDSTFFRSWFCEELILVLFELSKRLFETESSGRSKIEGTLFPFRTVFKFRVFVFSLGSLWLNFGKTFLEFLLSLFEFRSTLFEFWSILLEFWTDLCEVRWALLKFLAFLFKFGMTTLCCRTFLVDSDLITILFFEHCLSAHAFFCVPGPRN